MCFGPKRLCGAKRLRENSIFGSFRTPSHFVCSTAPRQFASGFGLLQALLVSNQCFGRVWGCIQQQIRVS
jgi:hypothetical protein